MNFHALIWKEPWLTPVVLNIRQVFKTTRIPSVGVSPDGKTLYYNPVFWKKLSLEEQIAVQIHEMLHIVYQHAERRKNREQGAVALTGIVRAQPPFFHGQPMK